MNFDTSYIEHEITEKTKALAQIEQMRNFLLASLNHLREIKKNFPTEKNSLQRRSLKSLVVEVFTSRQNSPLKVKDVYQILRENFSLEDLTKEEIEKLLANGCSQGEFTRVERGYFVVNTKKDTDILGGKLLVDMLVEVFRNEENRPMRVPYLLTLLKDKYSVATTKSRVTAIMRCGGYMHIFDRVGVGLFRLNKAFAKENEKENKK